MTNLYDFTRADWGARPAVYFTPLDYGKVRDLIVHYPGSPSPIGTDPDTIARRLRGWQDYDIDKRGWSDLAYNVAVDQMGRVWEGRGYNRRDGATSGRGGTSMSILAMVGNDEAPTDLMLSGILRVITEGKRRAPNAAVGPHSRYVSTSCPGDALRGWLQAGHPTPSGLPSGVELAAPIPAPTLDAPPFPLPRGNYFGPRSGPTRSVSGYYSHREDLRTWQQRMKDRGWRIDADGLYGPETARVARGFQSEKGLTADGLIGPDTWDAAWTSPLT